MQLTKHVATPVQRAEVPSCAAPARRTRASLRSQSLVFGGLRGGAPALLLESTRRAGCRRASRGYMRHAARIRSALAASAALGLVAVLVPPACTWSSTCSVDRITTESLPDATVGQVYSVTLTHNCSGREAASWTLLDGGLPPGLTLAWDGRLSGTPTVPGNFGFRVLLSLSSRGAGASTYPSGSDSRTYTLVVRP
jgi:hypothetical protein